MTSPTYHIIGDVHGCRGPLEALLAVLGYVQDGRDPDLWVPPPGAQAVFLGDLVDRGGDSIGCLQIARKMVLAGHARWVIGNHEIRARHILTYLLGRTKTEVPITPDALPTYVQLLALSSREQLSLRTFLDHAPTYHELIPDELIVVHARWENRFRDMSRNEQLKGCATGESDEIDRTAPDDYSHRLKGKRSARGLIDLNPFDGLSVRARWVRRWHGPAWVIWGHQVVRPGQVVRVGRTVCLDTGCCNGFALSAFVWPEHRIVQVDGDDPWRERMSLYEPFTEMLFPLEMTAVRQNVKDSGATDADAYVAYIDGILAAQEIPPMYPALARTHRTLFSRVHKPPRRPYSQRR